MFEELDYQQTALGAVSLRRRRDPNLGDRMVWEVKLADEFLMSSAFTEGECALAEAGLARLSGRDLSVVVGGLGLGYTAATALRDDRLTELVVIEHLAPVIGWHRRGWLTETRAVIDDDRCRIVAGDFFALSRGTEGFDHLHPGRRFDAVLLDIDHSPQHWLNASTAGFYSAAGLQGLAAHLRDGGVFGLWSNDEVDNDFVVVLESVFANVEATTISFPNPYQRADARCTLYFGELASAL